jgi:hypothetical protein
LATGGQGVEDDLRWIAANVSTAHRVSFRRIDPASIYSPVRSVLPEVPGATYSSGCRGGTNSSPQNGVPWSHSPQVTTRSMRVLFGLKRPPRFGIIGKLVRRGSRSDIHQLA